MAGNYLADEYKHGWKILEILAQVDPVNLSEECS